MKWIKNFIQNQLKTCCTKWFRGTWNHCCCDHDECYSKQQKKSKCDKDLGLCVLKARYIGWFFSPFMYVAVRVKGQKYYEGKTMKNIAKASKSSTIQYGLLGLGSILGTVFSQETITQLVQDFFTQNYAHAIYYTVVTALTALTGAGIIKGRFDAEKKPPLEDR